MSGNSARAPSPDSVYQFQPSHVLPVVFAVLIAVSLALHVYQNFHYRFWRITFFMFWGSCVFLTGWITRAVSTYNPANVNLYIVQTVFILAGPPIYSAAEYNILGRLMRYLPMHSPLHPGRLVMLFIYIGAAVESLTAAGASILATAKGDLDQYRRGRKLISAALVLQAAVECLFIYMVALIHYRSSRAKMLTKNVRTLCIMLYGTSTLVLLRCLFRAIESFSTLSPVTADNRDCNAICRVVTYNEWYLYAFEAAPMVLYTYWLNIMHPGRYLPSLPNQYLDCDGRTERMGPGWIDTRPLRQTFKDPMDIQGMIKLQASHDKFWLNPDKWPVARGSFALGTATNVASKATGMGTEKAQTSHYVEHEAHAK